MAPAQLLRRQVPAAARLPHRAGQSALPGDPRRALLPAAGGHPVPGRHGRRVPQAGRRAADREASAVAIGAKCLWQQLGVANLEADALARAAGLDSVMDRCVKIEHARLFGGLHWAGVNTGVISARRPRAAELRPA
jgi:hypothetical protein